jgi:hypothetical protein
MTETRCTSTYPPDLKVIPQKLCLHRCTFQAFSAIYSWVPWDVTYLQLHVFSYVTKA